MTLKKMMSETVTPDTLRFTTTIDFLHLYKIALNCYYKNMRSQFAKDETTIGTTPLTSMTIDTGTANPVSQKPISYSHETLSMGER